jgi:hypothetical protein
MQDVAMKYGFILLTFALHAWEVGFDICRKSVRAIINSQIPDVWAFTQRNSVPWILKEGVPPQDTLMVYSPDSVKISMLPLTSVVHKKRMDDVITAQILDSTGGLVLFDVTEFFHKLRWNTSTDENPSLYEMVLIYFLERGILVSDYTLSKYRLSVSTLDTPNITIPLVGYQVKKSFENWSAFAFRSSSAEEEREVLPVSPPVPAPASASAPASTAEADDFVQG